MAHSSLQVASSMRWALPGKLKKPKKETGSTNQGKKTDRVRADTSLSVRDEIKGPAEDQTKQNPGAGSRETMEEASKSSKVK